MEYGQDITAIVGESARIDVGEAIQYIKVGTDEIEAVAEQKIAEYNTNANEKTNAFNSNATSKTNTYNTNAQEKIDAYNSNVSGKIEAFNDLATSKTSAFNTNATNKTDAFNAVAAEKTSDFNENAAAKTTAFNENSDNRYNTYNSNATEKLSAYNLNATEKLTAYNNNDSSKTAIYNTNAESKVNDYNSNATSKTNAFNSNASTKTTAFNNNATDKTNAFNDNATSKTSDFNTNAQQKLEQASTYANNSKIWAEGLDGEVAPLGGTHSSKGWAEIAEAAASGVQNPANRDLSNLTNTGQMIIDSQNGTISNCILEIPQNLKIEIDSSLGVVLKAGSVVTLDGSTYSTYTTTEDKTQAMPGQGRRVLFVQETSSHNIVGWGINNVVSGATDSLAGQVYHLWFDTTNKEIKAYTTDGNTVAYRCAYPLCIVDVDADNNITFVKDSNGNDIIFNGWCYMGGSNNDTCSFIIYPNIKGLSPNGINSNGNLNSVNLSRSALTIINRTSAHDDLSVGLNLSNNIDIVIFDDIEYDNLSDITNPVDYTIYYIKSENRYYRYVSGNYTVRNNLPFIVFDKKPTGVAIKQVRQPYEGARDLLTDDKQVDVTTLTGYDSTQTQTLKNINGVLQWVTD